MTIVVMGTTGAGKTTVGKLLAARLGWEFLDADDLHLAASVAKMRQGIALDDADREPWLDAVRAEIQSRVAANRSLVVACSALKEAYRRKLLVDADVKVVYLRGTYDEIRKHLQKRSGHFAGESLLASQFAALEEPADALWVQATEAPDEIVRRIVTGFGIA